MPVFVIEIYRPGVTEKSADELAAHISAAASSMQLEGLAVRYLGGTFTPGDEVCFFRVEGDRRESVTRIAEDAGLGTVRISEVVEMAGS